MVKKRDKVVLIMRGPLLLCERAAVLLCILKLKPSFCNWSFPAVKNKRQTKNHPNLAFASGRG